LLLPCHGGSTLRALLLHAGRSAFMRFAMPAFRTHAGADRASRGGTAHATSTLSGLTSPLSSARPPGPCSVSSWHCHILLSGTVHSPAAASTATGATGHDKGVALQVATEPGLNDLAQVAGDERDHPDAISGNRLMVRPGDRAANQRTDAKLHQAKRLLGRQDIRIEGGTIRMERLRSPRCECPRCRRTGDMVGAGEKTGPMDAEALPCRRMRRRMGCRNI